LLSKTAALFSIKLVLYANTRTKPDVNSIVSETNPWYYVVLALPIAGQYISLIQKYMPVTIKHNSDAITNRNHK
jgi:hypothetical protein